MENVDTLLVLLCIGTVAAVVAFLIGNEASDEAEKTGGSGFGGITPPLEPRATPVPETSEPKNLEAIVSKVARGDAARKGKKPTKAWLKRQTKPTIEKVASDWGVKVDTKNTKAKMINELANKLESK